MKEVAFFRPEKADICTMNLLLVAATNPEVAATRQYLAEKMYQRKDCNVHTLITGVGLMHTAYVLTRYLSRAKSQPDLALQAGIGGSFHPFYPPGMVTVIREEVVGDLGVEENNTFRDTFDLELTENTFPYSSKMLINPHEELLVKTKLKPARGLSVNQVTTNSQRIHYLTDKYNAVIESMEGAAFHYVCLQEMIPFVQMRAVSNVVGERDKSRWLMKEAIENLNKELIAFIRPLIC